MWNALIQLFVGGKWIRESFVSTLEFCRDKVGILSICILWILSCVNLLYCPCDMIKISESTMSSYVLRIMSIY